MIKIDDDLLREVGLGALPAADKQNLLRHIYETLEMRVGMRLADQMTNEQLDEFETYFEAKDDAGAFKWLETNFPNYKDIVAEEFEKLKAEVTRSAPQILAATAAAPLPQPRPQPQPQAPVSQPQPQPSPQPQPQYAQPQPQPQPYQRPDVPLTPYPRPGVGMPGPAQPMQPPVGQPSDDSQQSNQRPWQQPPAGPR